MKEYIGFNPPFVGGGQGIMSQQRGSKLIRNDILQNILTIPGELPFRPNFGTSVREFVFDTMSPIDIQLLVDQVSEQITTNDPRLILNNIEIVPDNDNLQLNINITVSMKDDPEEEIEINRTIDIIQRN
jgi:phage baseplate assembly protein W